MEEKKKTLFGDLGKPTMRGIRKCPKCGTFNGTRGNTCKNKTCNLIFKESKEKKRGSRQLDAYKINTGSNSQIYSVRIRDRGPNLRGFVVMPLIEGFDNLQVTELELIIQSASQCYVESCPRSKEDFTNIALNIDTCHHITTSMASDTEAVELTFDSSILNYLPIREEMKHEVLQLNEGTLGPLVQRVSKSVMLVKCKNDRQALSYVHCYFFEHRRKCVDSGAVCECQMSDVLRPSTWKRNCRCVHYYACICCFLSNKKLEKEFQSFLNEDRLLPGGNNVMLTNLLVRKETTQNSTPVSHLVVCQTTNDKQNSSKDDPKVDKKRKHESEVVVTSPNEEEKSTSKEKTQPSILRKGLKQTSVIIDENVAGLSFLSWLGSITERINQTMHFKFSGKPDPLVFHVPQLFFDCLQQRISASSMKKRLPNVTSTFNRTDAVPLGVFTKYTWHITSVLHVKQIFDTPEVPLEITKSFVENKDGSYDPYDPQKNCEKRLMQKYKKLNNSCHIEPFELKTYLKVGSSFAGSKETSVFTLDWIPDILPFSKIGEMRITFEFGHVRNVNPQNNPVILCPKKSIGKS